jgi:SSS family transporter
MAVSASFAPQQSLPAALPASGLQLLDWAVLAAYLIVLLATAWLVSRRPRDANAYFLGNRSMPVWAVSLSVIATSMSAASFIGVPALAFSGDLTYLVANLGALLAVLVVAAYFIPAFYRYQVVTVYELIGRRFGPAAAMSTSWTFLIGRVFANGARLYIAALPLALLMAGDAGQPSSGQLMAAIATIAVIGTLYALVGGIASVIWTEVVQMVVLLGAVVCALIQLRHSIPLDLGGLYDVLSAARTGSDRLGAGHAKLTVLSLSLSPGAEFTLFTALSGWLLLNLAAYGTDQDLAQRMLTCRSAAAGGRSAISAILLGIPIQLLFMALGLLLYVFYARPDIMAPRPYPQPVAEQAFLTFIIREMPAGLRGLMLAGLFAVAFTSLLSALNAMAASAVNDVYRPLARSSDARLELLVSRLAVLLWGAVLGLFACLCVSWRSGDHDSLLGFALGIMSFAYAGLLAVFLTALFTRRGNAASAIGALLTGFAVITLLQPRIWLAVTQHDSVLAAPWRMLIATGLAFLVCAAGRPAPSAARL